MYTRRKAGKPKRRRLDRGGGGMMSNKRKGLSEEEVYDRATWMHMSSNVDPT